MSDAPPDPKAVIGGTFSDAAATYDQVIDFFAPFGRALVAAADLPPGAKVLDVASGRGACLYPALEAVGPSGSVLGIDLAPGMVAALGAELAAGGHVNAEVRLGDVEQLDLPDGWFDAATGGFVIFFPPDPPRALRELHRVLRPGGTLALSIFDGPPGFPWMDEVAEQLVGPSPRMPSHEFNKAEVLDPALVAAGFEPPEALVVRERFLFADLGEFEQWQWSHGGRLLLGRLDGPGRARYRQLVSERLEAHRVEGGFELVQQARMTVTRKP